MTGLHWLPPAPDWRGSITALRAAPDWAAAMALADTRLDFVRTNAVDEILRRAFPSPPDGVAAVRLAVLASATVTHLAAPIRVAGLRRGLHIAVHEADYGQYFAALTDPASPLHAFGPDAILFSFDAAHVTASLPAGATVAEAAAVEAGIVAHWRACWREARAACAGPVLQQTVLPTAPTLFGSNEQRLPGAPAALIARLNAALPALAADAGVVLLDIAGRAAAEGIDHWHDPALWHRSKQEVSPIAAPVYGDCVGRILAAARGRSAKALVLDLDNTLWGGVIGDDGMGGIVLGQGSAGGEAFLAVQAYAKRLAARGIILAVCSKNTESVALEVFEKHPDMVLRRRDIASFVANWDDKPSNIRRIAEELNIGLDALVFLDDNPFERQLVRATLPMVSVPELSDEPASYPRVLADAGYFEALALTAEDRSRGAAYQQNAERAAARGSSTDLPAYLRGLAMTLLWSRFDDVGFNRIVQLINKTNQFNLTTRRVADADIRAVIDDPARLGLQLRLTDQFGDNGIIAILIGALQADGAMVMETWLMSCRVLGRQVEEASLDLLVRQARAMGAVRLVGEYIPTAKNGMVRDHYRKLGFSDLPDGRFGLELAAYDAPDLFIEVQEV